MSEFDSISFDEAAERVFQHTTVHDFSCFMSWLGLNKPGDLDIYRPNYDAMVKVLKQAKDSVFPE